MPAPKNNQFALNNNGGRPSKLTRRFLTATRKVLEGEYATLIYTDEQLLISINERLPEELQVSWSAFKRWKREINSCWSQKEKKIHEEFQSLFIWAFTKIKINLFKKMMEAPRGSWRRFAWIIERKYPEWNLRKRTEALRRKIDPEKEKKLKEIQELLMILATPDFKRL